jgi:hypothetical protein
MQLYTGFILSSPSILEWLNDEDNQQLMLSLTEKNQIEFWNIIFSEKNWVIFEISIKRDLRTNDQKAFVKFVSDYLLEYLHTEIPLNKFILLSTRRDPEEIKPVLRRSRRLQGLPPEAFGKVNRKQMAKQRIKSRAKQRIKPRSKPKRKPRSKPKRKPRSKPKRKPRSKSSDTILKNKLKMVGIKVTKMVKGKRVKLTKKELQKRISAFKKLQTKAKKLKVSLKYKSTSGRYKFKSQRRLISEIKKATKRKATKRKATKRKATKRKATKRKATKRKN